jgi:cell division control protein 7
MADHNQPQHLSEDCFEILGILGTGAFSTVFLGRSRRTNCLYALKRLIPSVAPERIVKEVQWLKRLNHPSVVKIFGVFRKEEQVTLVLEHIPHTPFRDYLPNLTAVQVKLYMVQLLRALEHFHGNRIIHRDVKPSNFLFEPTTNQGRLIDCGLCEDDLWLEPVAPVIGNEHKKLGPPPYDMLYPHLCQKRPKMLGNRAGTRGFRAPEVLMGAWNQGAKIDVWGAGVILLSLLTRRYPFFKAADAAVALCEIACVVGSARIELAAVECLRRVQFPHSYKKQDLRDLVIGLYPPFLREGWDESVFDLAKGLLEPVPSRRFSAAAALEHPFLAEFRPVPLPPTEAFPSP